MRDCPPCISCRVVREASLRSTDAQRAVQRTWISTRAAMLGKRRQRRFLRFSRGPPRETATPLLPSDEIASRSARHGGQTQASRTSEPTATPYHIGYNDRHGEPAHRSRRRPAAPQGGTVTKREVAKHTLRHNMRHENTATHRRAGARHTPRDGRAYAAASCHGTQKSRTPSASSDAFRFGGHRPRPRKPNQAVTRQTAARLRPTPRS